ncbi:MAG: hypothetical protein IKP09_08865 [Lentisphaeria bacterium]|nr:hypothetical protein [Lentisphaeria bacterium]
MKCEQCGFLVDSLPEGGGEYLCPNCGWVMRKGPPAVPDDGQPSPTDTATNTHLKIAKTVNVGFGDFASVLAATDASRIAVPDDRDDDPGRTRTATASGSTLNVEEPDDDDALAPLDVYDEDDEYARIQADIAARRKALDERAAELDAREKHLNKKLDEIIAEKEFLRTGIEKTDEERASYLKQKGVIDAQRADFEKEMAARQKALDARSAELDRKSEALARTRAALEDLKRELDASMTGDKNRIDDDHTSSSVSIPYSAKLLRQNNALSRTVRIQKRVLICLAALAAVLIVLLFVRESELRRARTAPEPEQSRTPAASAAIIGGADGPTAVFLTSELLKRESGRSAGDVSASAPAAEQQLPAPESEKSGGGL